MMKSKPIRTILFWIVWNVPLGRLAPYALGLALGSKPHKLHPTEVCHEE